MQKDSLSYSYSGENKLKQNEILFVTVKLAEIKNNVDDDKKRENVLYIY